MIIDVYFMPEVFYPYLVFNVPDIYRQNSLIGGSSNARGAIHRGNRLSGRGSDEHVDFDDDDIKYLISSTDAG